MKKKNHFISSQDFVHNNLLILFSNVLCNCKASNNDGNKWLLLDVNPKTWFLHIQKIPKAQKLKKISQKKFLSDLVLKLLILFVQCKLMF